MKVLDLGCGQGLTPQKLNFPADWQAIGLDVDRTLLAKARLAFPDRSFICSRGEALPFASCSFHRVIANVALPYMNISRALKEIHRVLVPGGTMLCSLHPVSFTIDEFRRVQQKPKAALYRLCVLANGVLFHVTGLNLGETFQTERGIRIAASRAHLVDVSFRHDSKRWFVEATKASE
ncbi:MAG TPA: class I SAM-dependent methyltransferase [Verrucomicrobiae bacterium]|nr:class I SAM-dependent methyltransferase [Verrucomicrobiae bacterium]